MTRLINADALTNKYGDWYTEEGTEVGFIGSLKTLIDLQPTIDAQPHWIPCSERLPDKNGYYLTTTCYRQVYCDFWNEDHFDRTEAVIAWMPLPEPYEGNHE